MSNSSEMPGNVLVVSPHPDDEIIGAGATILTLQAAGHTVINLAASLGRPEQHERRRAELTEACSRAGIELIIPEKPALISGGDDLKYAQDYLSELITSTYKTHQPQIVIAPSVHDAHHGHEVVARATRDSLSKIEGSRLWMWNMWGELPYPNLYSPFNQETLDKVTHALEAYEGENDRNDYRRMVLGRALLGSVLGTEKVFGFGAAAVSELPYAELLTEVVRTDGEWAEGTKRVLSPDNVLETPLSTSLDAWVNSTSPHQHP